MPLRADVCNIVVRRYPLSAFMNMIFPSFLVMALSLMSFWGDACNVVDRASITLTLLLTQTAGSESSASTQTF